MYSLSNFVYIYIYISFFDIISILNIEFVLFPYTIFLFLISILSGMQDYNYLHTNSFEITLELGCEKYPNASELPRYWNENKMSLLNYILQVSLCNEWIFQ